MAAGAGDKVPDPDDRSGFRIFAEHDEPGENKSKAGRMRRITVRNISDVRDGVKEKTKAVEGLFQRPPTGQATATPGAPAISTAPRAASVPDMMMGATIGAVMLIEMGRWVMRKLTKPKEGK